MLRPLKLLIACFVNTHLYGAMPAQKPNLGTKTLACVVVEWTNPNIGDAASCKAMADYVSAFYNRNSRGQLALKIIVGSVSTGVAGTASNVTVGEDLVKAKYKADYYIIPNKFYGSDHAGGHIAHLEQILDTVATHEVGHLLPINHTTRLNWPAPALDTESIMNPYARPSDYITAPQYYWLGWMHPTEYVAYDGTAGKQFLLRHPLDSANAAPLATVIVPHALMSTGTLRDAFISFPAACADKQPACVALHLINQPSEVDGNSQLVKEINPGASYFDSQFTGLNLAVGQVANGAIQVTVSFGAPALADPNDVVEANVIPPAADAKGCQQIDPKNVDTDGMPFCPPIVTQSSAYAVYSCALQQAKSFHGPTPAEKQSFVTLLGAYQTVLASGKAAATTGVIMAQADSLGLQVCRVSQVLDGAPDSFLLLYTKPGVNNYSGPFVMLREVKPSKVVIIGPHDDSDGTYADTKIGLAKSHAMTTISNGHMRGNVGAPNGDFVHEGLTENLGTWYVNYFTSLFPGSIVMQIHGWASVDTVLVDSRKASTFNPSMLSVFENAIVANSKVPAGNFKPLLASFSIDDLVHTNNYIKTEMPAGIHEKNWSIIADIVNAMEKYPWAWK